METLSWEALEMHLAGKTPTILSMGGRRGVRIGFDPVRSVMFVRLPIAHEANAPPCRYAELDVAVRQDDSGRVLEVSTGTERLYREFHRFAGLLAEDFEQVGRTAVDAFDAAIDRWQDFASWKGLLSDEQQVGVYGELMFLEALLRRDGPVAVMAWTGRNESLPERHDFRIRKFDIEVKTTRSATRRHFVHGLGQLMPSHDHELFILSIRIEGAGLESGLALYERVARIRSSLLDADVERREFEARLSSSGYRDSDAEHYRTRFILADSPMLIPVDQDCPRITSTMLSKWIAPDVAGRVDEVSYTVNLNGLGAAQGTTTFQAVLGTVEVE